MGQMDQLKVIWKIISDIKNETIPVIQESEKKSQEVAIFSLRIVFFVILFTFEIVYY